MEQSLADVGITTDKPLSELQAQVLRDLHGRLTHYLLLETRWLEASTGMYLTEVDFEVQHTHEAYFSSRLNINVINPPQN